MKKGFSIVELAIVLVVIGLILAIAVKARALVEVARYKAEINKIRKLDAALHQWIIEYGDGFEFDLSGGEHNDNHGYMDMQLFYEKGILRENELESMAVNIAGDGGANESQDYDGQNGHWSLVHCMYNIKPDRLNGNKPRGGLATYRSVDYLNSTDIIKFEGTNICAEISVGLGTTDVGDDAHVGRYDYITISMPLRLQCMVELYLDDEDRTTGKAQYDSVLGYDHNDFDKSVYKDCMALSMEEPKNSNLLYVLY